MSAFHVLGIFLLVGINAFFSATEFSLVAVRLSRVRQLVEKGDPRAKIVEHLLGDLSRVVSGVQVGITIASLSLGYLGEVTLAAVLRPTNDLGVTGVLVLGNGANLRLSQNQDSYGARATLLYDIAFEAEI